RPSPDWTSAIWVLLVLLFLQIVAGAFVAGLDAGSAHNTWPLMEGQLIPSGLLAMQPFWANFFENVMTVQFNHRKLAYLITAYVALIWWFGRKSPGYEGVH